MNALLFTHLDEPAIGALASTVRRASTEQPFTTRVVLGTFKAAATRRDGGNAGGANALGARSLR